MDSKTKQEYMKSFARVGAIVGLSIGNFLLGDEDENVETETSTHQGTKHKSQSNLGEQHAAGNESDESTIDPFFAFGVQFIKAIGESTIHTTRMLSDLPINRPPESPLGIEGKTGSETTTNTGNDSANG